jgi:hypothetical protein
VALCLALFAADALAQNPEKFERVVPARPQPEAPKVDVKPPVNPAPVQPVPRVIDPQDPYVAEIMRKAMAGAKEDGFCDRAPWTEIETRRQGYAIMESATPGQIDKVKTDAPPPRCAVRRVLSAGMEGARRCVRYEAWACRVGFICSYTRPKFCREATGPYQQVTQ